MPLARLQESLSELLQRAERAALSMNGAALDQTTEDLELLTSQLLQHRLAKSELESLRSRLRRFVGTCEFAGETLRQAVLESSQAPFYQPRGQKTVSDTPMLMGRYG